MDLIMDILSNVTKILDDIEADSSINAAKILDSEYKAAYMGQGGNRRSRGRKRFNSDRKQKHQQTYQLSKENIFC